MTNTKASVPVELLASPDDEAVASSGSCCEPAALSTCCEASAKSACCGAPQAQVAATPPAECGCQ